MDTLESLRKKLYAAIGTGDKREILRLSRELDDEILRYMKEDARYKELEFQFARNE